MELNWSNIKDEELRAILASINTELTARDNAKAKKLRNAINEALDDLCKEYPNACWMVVFEDDNGEWTKRDLLRDVGLDADDIIL